MANNQTDPDEDFEFEKSKYGFFWKERQSLIDAERINAQSFDKAILTLSSGAIVLSLTFIDAFKGYKFPPCLLITTWGLFVSSMLSTLIAFWVSGKAHRISIEWARIEWKIGDAIKEPDKVKIQAQKQCFSFAITVLNFLSLTLFLGGLTIMFIFIYETIYKGLS